MLFSAEPEPGMPSDVHSSPDLPELPHQILAGRAVHVHVEQIEHQHGRAQPGCAHCAFQGVLHGKNAAGQRGVARNELLERDPLRPVEHLLAPGEPEGVVVMRGVKQTAFEREPVENAGSGNGAKQVDAGYINAGLLDKLLKHTRHVERILVESVDKTAVDADACIPDVFDTCRLPGCGVVKLLMGVVAAVGEAFDPDKQRSAPGSGEGVKESGLFAKRGGSLTYPAYAERNEFPKEFFGIELIGVNGIVKKKEDPFVLFEKIFNLPKHGGNGAVTKPVAVHDVHVAEVAVVGAPPRGLHHVGGEIAANIESALADNAIDREIGKGLNPVLRFEIAAEQILLHLSPDIVGLPDHKGVAVLAAPVGKNSDIGPAKHNLDASGSERTGKFERRLDSPRLNADACHVPVPVERKLFESKVADGLAHALHLL